MYQYDFVVKCVTCVCNTLYNEQMKVCPIYMKNMHAGLGIGFDTGITWSIEECMLVWV